MSCLALACTLAATLAACGDDPIVIFRVTSSTTDLSAAVQVCEPGTLCTGRFVDLLSEGDTSGDGALFEVPSGVTEVPVQVQQGGTAIVCKRSIVPIGDPPVEVTIKLGISGPELTCPSGVACRDDGCCRGMIEGVCAL